MAEPLIYTAEISRPPAESASSVSLTHIRVYAEKNGEPNKMRMSRQVLWCFTRSSVHNAEDQMRRRWHGDAIAHAAHLTGSYIVGTYCYAKARIMEAGLENP